MQTCSKPICEIVVSKFSDSDSDVPVVIQKKKAVQNNSLFFYMEYKRFTLSSKARVDATKSQQKKLISFLCVDRINVIIFFVQQKLHLIGSTEKLMKKAY